MPYTNEHSVRMVFLYKDQLELHQLVFYSIIY